jgi:hypothetical protein
METVSDTHAGSTKHVDRSKRQKELAPHCAHLTKPIEVERAPLVPCLCCGRLMPLVACNASITRLRGVAVPYIKCSDCTRRDFHRYPLRKHDATPDEEAAYKASCKRRAAWWNRLVRKHAKTRIEPVAKALLANVRAS